jgi:hypothetical protein
MKEDGVDNHWEKFPHWNLLSNRKMIRYFLILDDISL